MIKRLLPTFALLFALLFAPCGFTWSQAAPPTDIHLSELQSWLQSNWYNGYHSSLGYNEARRQMYGYVDIAGGQIECVYTGFTQSGGYITYPNPINAEHLVPQSFFGSSEPMKSDIHILKPCHGSANSARGNKPYNDVIDSQAQWYGTVNNSYTSQGSAPSNSEVWSESSGGDWEPREDRKGDVARAAFYFYTMYPDAAGAITEMGPTDILYQWHLDDPADATEISRNDKAASQQGNRNPYIDYPDLVYNAWLW
ncbi:MAG: endonuclease, partial [Flavobacteriales bacterium]